MATIFTDDYQRADTSALGANYTEAQGDSAIVSNKIRVGSSSGTTPGLLLTTTTAHPDTTDVKVTVTQSVTGADGGPMARCTDSDTAPTLYICDCYTGFIEIYRHDNNGTGTLLRSTVNTQAANGVIRLEVTGNGAIVTLQQFYNNVQMGADVSDASGQRIVNPGRTGILNYVNGGTTARDYDDLLIENFLSDPDPADVLGSRDEFAITQRQG